jgi:hypothetical protein
MPKMVFDEWYGELSYAQRVAYRKFKVPPAMHDDLIGRFGAQNHERITAFIKAVAAANNGRIDYSDMTRTDLPGFGR